MDFSKLATQKPQQEITEAQLKLLQQDNKVDITRKYNGFHVDIFRQQGNLYITSHGAVLLYNAMLPTLTAELADIVREGDFLVGELTGIADSTEHIQDCLNQQQDDKLEVRLYDCMFQHNNPIWELPLAERITYYQAYKSDRVRAVQHLEPTLSLQQQLALCKENNWEGTVIADLAARANLNVNGNVKRGRLWKNKPKMTQEFVVEVCKLDKNGQILTLRAYNLDGTPAGTLGSFEVTFSKQPRQGKFMVEVAYCGKDSNGNLVFPVVLRERYHSLV